MKTKILLLYTRFPFPLDSGDNVSRAHILKNLNKIYDVHLVIVNDKGSSKEKIDFIKENTSSYKVFDFPKWRFLLKVVKGFITTKLPLQVNYFYFDEVKKYLIDLTSKEDFKICVAYMMRTAKYTDGLDLPIYLDAQDSYFFRAKDSIENNESLLWKTINKVEANRFFDFEKHYVQKLPLVSYVNDKEALFWSEYGNAVNVPFGVKDFLFDYDKFDSKYADSIVFLGKMSYQPNIDAILWFKKNVIDNINKNIKVIIIGADPPKSIKDMQADYPNVTVMGFVDDPYEIINSSICLFAPMQSGSGVQNKIMEAMALGQVVVSTSMSAYSIVGVQNQKNILIADTPDHFATTINNLYERKLDVDHIKTNAKETIRGWYTWKRTSELLAKNIDSIKRD